MNFNIHLTYILIIILIISFFLMILSRIQNEKKNNIESFTNNNNNVNNSITYPELDLDQIKFIEPKDTHFFKNSYYLSSMNQINVNARNFMNKNQCYKNYQNAFQIITEKERRLIKLYIKSLMNEIYKLHLDTPQQTHFINYYNYLKFWLLTSNIQFAKQQNWLESNMPHTHNTTIVFPHSLFINPKDSILLHELTHIHQRKQINDFENLYHDWGFFKHHKPIKGLENKVLLSRHNPDGLELNWLWKCPIDKENKIYWITAEFNNLDEPNLTNVSYLAYPVDTDSRQNYYYLNKTPIHLTSLSNFNSYFGITNNHYHPNEISAQYAEYYLEDIKVNRNNKTTKRDYPAYYIYLDWMNTIIKNY